MSETVIPSSRFNFQLMNTFITPFVSYLLEYFGVYSFILLLYTIQWCVIFYKAENTPDPNPPLHQVLSESLAAHHYFIVQVPQIECIGW